MVFTRSGQVHDRDICSIHHVHIEHALINSFRAWTLRRLLGQLTVRTVDGEITQGDKLREVNRQDMSITTVSMVTGRRAGRVRVKFQHARTVLCTRQGQIGLIADMQGAVVAQWGRVRASCQDADPWREFERRSRWRLINGVL